MNCDCDPTKPCTHTAQADVDRALRLLRGLTNHLSAVPLAQLDLAIQTLERLDLPRRILRGEYDAQVRERARDIEIAEMDAKLAPSEGK